MERRFQRGLAGGMTDFYTDLYDVCVFGDVGMMCVCVCVLKFKYQYILYVYLYII